MGKSINKSRDRLQLSRLDSQKELLSDDLDLTQLSFITKTLPAMRFEESVVSGEVNRTIEGASTVVITVNDNDGLISKSGRLASKVDIKIDGLWFRLVKVTKSGVNLTMTFESREVAILRTYSKRRLTGWGKMSRARFAQILVNEPNEFGRTIPFVSPDPKKLKGQRTKAEKAKERNSGFGYKTDASLKLQAGKGLTVKGKEATVEQVRNAEEVLDAGQVMLVKRKLLVCSIMTVIQESTVMNLVGGDRDSVGIFQQRASMGWPASRNITTDATEFFKRAVKYDIDHPRAQYWEVCQGVQRSAFPKAYQQWKNEAEAFVTAYGVAGGDLSDDKSVAAANNMQAWQPEETADEMDQFQFYRGKPKTGPGGKRIFAPENSWECLVRLAEEVQWRCFEVSGTIYFVSEPWLFKSAPRARLSELSGGVDWIDYDLDIGKRNSTITIKARVSTWEAPPGTTIEIFDEGVINGRWLVTEITRSFFDPLATITCKKPRAILPEPKREDLTSLFDQTKDPNVYVPTPGINPDLPDGQPTGKALRDAVLNNSNIKFTRTSQQNDIQFGLIHNDVLAFLMHFTEAGFPVTITSLRSDHSKMTSSGNPSAHAVGRAVDMGNYGSNNPDTYRAMSWIKLRQIQLKFSQLIGPIDGLCVPLGYYDSSTLQQHDDHIHVGWSI
jgi:uncharacterized protein YukE